MKQLLGMLRTAHKHFLPPLDLEVAVEEDITSRQQGVNARGVSLMGMQVTPTTWLTRNHPELRSGHRVPQGKGLSLRNMVWPKSLFRSFGMQELVQILVLLKIPTAGINQFLALAAWTDLGVPVHGDVPCSMYLFLCMAGDVLSFNYLTLNPWCTKLLGNQSLAPWVSKVEHSFKSVSVPSWIQTQYKCNFDCALFTYQTLVLVFFVHFLWVASVCNCNHIPPSHFQQHSFSKSHSRDKIFSLNWRWLLWIWTKPGEGTLDTHIYRQNQINCKLHALDPNHGSLLKLVVKLILDYAAKPLFLGHHVHNFGC